MTIADLMILIAAFLPYATVAFAKAGARKRFNNADPRNLAHFNASEMRAYNAHLNGFEMFPFFAIAVLFAEFRVAPQVLIDALSLLFIGLRLLYTVAYVGNKPTLRSLCFGAGFILTVAIFVLPFFFS